MQWIRPDKHSSPVQWMVASFFHTANNVFRERSNTFALADIRKFFFKGRLKAGGWEDFAVDLLPVSIGQFRRWGCDNYDGNDDVFRVQLVTGSEEVWEEEKRLVSKKPDRSLLGNSFSETAVFLLGMKRGPFVGPSLTKEFQPTKEVKALTFISGGLPTWNWKTKWNTTLRSGAWLLTRLPR